MSDMLNKVLCNAYHNESESRIIQNFRDSYSYVQSCELLSYPLLLQRDTEDSWQFLIRAFFDALLSIIYGPGGNGKNRIINILMTVINTDNGSKIF